jgi:hypothetical protein
MLVEVASEERGYAAATEHRSLRSNPFRDALGIEVGEPVARRCGKATLPICGPVEKK